MRPLHRIAITLLTLIAVPQFSLAADTEHDVAVATVKNHPEVREYLESRAGEALETSFESISMGQRCGVAGCDWTRLVALTIQSDASNAPAISLYMKVKGMSPARVEATAEFVNIDLKPVNPALLSCHKDEMRDGKCAAH